MLHGGFEQIGTGLVYWTEFADFGGTHPIGRLRTIGVNLQRNSLKPLLLNSSRHLHPLPHLGARLARALTAELFKEDAETSPFVHTRKILVILMVQLHMQ
jgi:hypothetical protein